MTEKKVWTAKVGFADTLSAGADLPMRHAVAAAFQELTGSDPEFIFSGWGGSLTESELAVVEGRLPEPADYLANLVRNAAPDLLAACEALFEAYAVDVQRPNSAQAEAHRAAVAAIAKARGEQR